MYTKRDDGIVLSLESSRKSKCKGLVMMTTSSQCLLGVNTLNAKTQFLGQSYDLNFNVTNEVVTILFLFTNEKGEA